MIFNFEHEIAGVLYDVDAETRVDRGVLEFVLLEVRIVADDGDGYVLLDLATADKGLLDALRVVAGADYMDRCSP